MITRRVIVKDTSMKNYGTIMHVFVTRVQQSRVFRVVLSAKASNVEIKNLYLFIVDIFTLSSQNYRLV